MGIHDTLLTKVQEVYFDLCDLLDNNELDDRIDGFQEFDSLRDFAYEQKAKMAQIERIIEQHIITEEEDVSN